MTQRSVVLLFLLLLVISLSLDQKTLRKSCELHCQSVLKVPEACPSFCLWTEPLILHHYDRLQKLSLQEMDYAVLDMVRWLQYQGDVSEEEIGNKFIQFVKSIEFVRENKDEL